jgi:hypothetical protein
VPSSRVLVDNIVSAVFFVAFTTSSPVGNSFDIGWEVIACLVDYKARTRLVDGTGDSCQGDSVEA